VAVLLAAHPTVVAVVLVDISTNQTFTCRQEMQLSWSVQAA
jgi:hypothetical protein